MSAILDAENISYDLFCLDYSENDFAYVLPNLPKPIGAEDVYRYSDQKLSLPDKVRVLLGSFFRLDVFSRLDKVLREKQYEQIIVLQYFLKLSPAVFLAAKKNSDKAILVLSVPATLSIETGPFVPCVLKTSLIW
jgi:hypothetical protein